MGIRVPSEGVLLHSLSVFVHSLFSPSPVLLFVLWDPDPVPCDSLTHTLVSCPPHTHTDTSPRVGRPVLGTRVYLVALSPFSPHTLSAAVHVHLHMYIHVRVHTLGQVDVRLRLTPVRTRESLGVDHGATGGELPDV